MCSLRTGAEKVPLICIHAQWQCFFVISSYIAQADMYYCLLCNINIGRVKGFFFFLIVVKSRRKPKEVHCLDSPTLAKLFVSKVLRWPAALTFKYIIIFSTSSSQYLQEAVLSWETESQKQHPSQDAQEQNSCSKCPRFSATPIDPYFPFPRRCAKKAIEL